MPNSLQASTSECSYSTVCCCVCYTRLLISIMIFFLEGCDVRVLEKPPGGYFTYEEIKEASSFALFYLYK